MASALVSSTILNSFSLTSQALGLYLGPSSQVQGFTMLVISVVLLSLISIAVAAPATDSNAVDHLQKRATQCYALERRETSVLTVGDCRQAVRAIPTTRGPGGDRPDHVDGQFSNYRPLGSPFKLPQHFAYGNCMIGVSMIPSSVHVEETSNWNDISVKAAAIVDACVARPRPFQRGGTETTGQYNSILIEMFNYSPHLNFLVPLNNPMANQPGLPPLPAPKPATA
ncbi:MAG: hypothetical protein M1830_009111 [Pleopsidium flavum]|nr:MAG: hypothetical protein M1830_009111 [Pleopsidium flavum]